MANFPTSLDDGTTLPNPSAVNKTNSPSHASLHSTGNDAIKALEAKVGIGATTPTANTLLRGTGTGTTAWGTLTSAQLGATISDETGSGSLVFATTPTLVTPKVDTINENTPGNGTTIGGVNIRSGALNTNNSVVTANITNAAVTPNKINLGAQSAYVATSETTASTSFVRLTTTTDQINVTVGANGLLMVGIYCLMANSGANVGRMSFALSGATTQAASTIYSISNVTTGVNFRNGAVFLLTGLTAGSTTVAAYYNVDAGTGTYADRRIFAVPL